MPFLIAIFVIIMMVGLAYNLYEALAANDPGSKTGMAIWVLVPTLVGWSISSNFGVEMGRAAVPVAAILMLAFCCYRPQNSSLKSKMLSGLKVPASLVATICLTVPSVRFLYAVLSGELKNEGLAGLPVDWMLSLVYPGLFALGVVFFVAYVRKFGIDQFEKEERRRYQEKAETASTERAREQAHGYDDPTHDGQAQSKQAPPSDEEAPWPDVLGVPRSATKDEIKFAANQLRKTYHPDKMAQMPRFRIEAERQMKIINRAVDEAFQELASRAAT